MFVILSLVFLLADQPGRYIPFQVDLSDTECIRKGRPDLTLMDELGRVVWSSSDDKKTQWFQKPGAYRLRLHWASGDGFESRFKTLHLTGDELQLNARITFCRQGEAINLYQFRVVRVMASLPEVNISASQDPGAEDIPIFRIINGSEKPLYGAGLKGQFTGSFFIKEKGEWVLLDRGSCCGSIKRAAPLMTGSSIWSSEEPLCNPKPVPEGFLRYQVYYSLKPVMGDNGVHTLYSLVSDFYHP